MISSTSSRIGSGSAKARVDVDQRAEPLAPRRVAAGDRVDRPAGPRQGDAERRPDRAGADDADDRRLAGPGMDWCGMGVVARVGRRRRGGASRAAAGSRSMPAASMAASVSAPIAAPGRRRAGRPRPSSSVVAGHRPIARAASIECSERSGATGDPHPTAVYWTRTSTRGGRTRPAPTDPAHRRGRRRRRVMTTPTSVPDPFGARASLGPASRTLYRLDAVADRIDLAGPAGHGQDPARERCSATPAAASSRRADVETLLAWRPGAAAEAEIPFMPARVLLQDFTGVPAVVDLAVMRDAMADLGGDPAQVNPLVPADLVIDHSVQVDRFGTPGAFAFNVEREYERNGERYQLLRWAQTAFRDLRVVPPGTGIVHQVNLEFLATVVADRDGRRRPAGRLPGHARRHRLAHDDGQRPRRPGLRRRRHRGRGGPARPAALPADAARRRRPPPRRAAARLDRDRPRPRRDRAAPRARRRRRVRRVRRRRPGDAGPRRPGDDQQHEPRVRGDRDALPDRRRDARLPAPDRPLAPSGSTSSSATPRRRACGASPATARPSTSCSSSTWRPSTPSVAGPRRPQDRVPLTDAARQLPDELPERARGHVGDLGGEAPVAGDGVVEDASAASFPASDPPSFAAADAVDDVAPPAEPVVAGRAPVDGACLPAGRRSRSAGGRHRSGPARSPSPRSRRAPTPRTRR